MKKDTKIEYVFIPKSTITAYRITQEHVLTIEDVVKININKDLIKKFIEQRALSLQFDIGSGKWAGKETIGLLVQEELVKIAQDIGKIDETLKEQQIVEKIKERKEKEKKENIE